VEAALAGAGLAELRRDLCPPPPPVRGGANCRRVKDWWWRARSSGSTATRGRPSSPAARTWWPTSCAGASSCVRAFALGGPSALSCPPRRWALRPSNLPPSDAPSASRLHVGGRPSLAASGRRREATAATLRVAVALTGRTTTPPRRPAWPCRRARRRRLRRAGALLLEGLLPPARWRPRGRWTGSAGPRARRRRPRAATGPAPPGRLSGWLGRPAEAVAAQGRGSARRSRPGSLTAPSRGGTLTMNAALACSRSWRWSPRSPDRRATSPPAGGGDWAAPSPTRSTRSGRLRCAPSNEGFTVVDRNRERGRILAETDSDGLELRLRARDELVTVEVLGMFPGSPSPHRPPRRAGVRRSEISRPPGALTLRDAAAGAWTPDSTAWCRSRRRSCRLEVVGEQTGHAVGAVEDLEVIDVPAGPVDHRRGHHVVLNVAELRCTGTGHAHLGPRRGRCGPRSARTPPRR
jgi:hypothetical protein